MLLCESGARASHAITNTTSTRSTRACVFRTAFLHAVTAASPFPSSNLIANDTTDARFLCSVRNFCALILLFSSTLFFQHQRCWAASHINTTDFNTHRRLIHLHYVLHTRPGWHFACCWTRNCFQGSSGERSSSAGSGYGGGTSTGRRAHGHPYSTTRRKPCRHCTTRLINTVDW